MLGVVAGGTIAAVTARPWRALAVMTGIIIFGYAAVIAGYGTALACCVEPDPHGELTRGELLFAVTAIAGVPTAIAVAALFVGALAARWFGHAA